MFKGVICSGAILLGMTAAMPDAETRVRRMICEEWRDYYYNTRTGEFIEWASEPYLRCWYEDEPMSIPLGNPHPDYGGGWGIPRDPRHMTCRQCAIAHEDCADRVVRGRDRCIDHYREQAHRWCVDVQRTRDGRPIGDDYECIEVMDQRGRPVQECFGPAIDACEEDFAQDRPGSSVQDKVKVNIGLDWFGVGADHSSTIMWGGSHGYIRGCWDAQHEADAICVSNLHTCEEAAGGCR